MRRRREKNEAMQQAMQQQMQQQQAMQEAMQAMQADPSTVEDLQATVVKHEAALISNGQARAAPSKPQVQVDRYRSGDHTEYLIHTKIGAARHSVQRRVTEFRVLHEKLRKRPQLELGAFPLPKVLKFFQMESVKRRAGDGGVETCGDGTARRRRAGAGGALSTSSD